MTPTDATDVPTSRTASPSGYCQAWCSIFFLTARGEPYRLLFPLGVTLGILGVILWPAFIYGWLPLYPGVMHSRIMVQGFLFSFIAGFLGSALPHMLEIKGLSMPRTLIITGMILTTVLLHILGRTAWADALFPVTVATTILLILYGWSNRKDLPPPGMVLAGLGLLSGMTGSALLALFSKAGLPDWTYPFGKILLYQGLILFPVLGLGVYLLPRMAGLPNRHMIAKSPHLSTQWSARAGFMLLCGLVLICSFIMEILNWYHAAYGLRTATVIYALLHEVPLHRARKIRGSIPRSLMIATACIITGYLLMAAWPERRVTMLHVVFITGIGLLVLNIGARVILGHSGHTELIYGRFRSVNWITGLALLAMSTRVSADLLPRMQLSHYSYAAITWTVLSLVWLMRFSGFLTAGSEEETASSRVAPEPE